MLSCLLMLSSVQATEIRVRQAPSLSCPKYICNQIFTFGNSTCGEYYQDNYHMQACQDPMQPICNKPGSNTGDWTCSARPTIASGSLYPGQMCNMNGDCKSGACTGGRCIGAQRAAACTATADCAPNLRCAEDDPNDANTCQPLFGEGLACTTSDECVLGAECHNNVCTAILSLPNGTVVGSCSNGISGLCMSANCENTGGLFSTQYTCIPAAVSTTTPPMMCGSDSDCTAKRGNATETGTCSCGYNAVGQSYCSVQGGDYVATDFLSAWKKFNKSNAAAAFCHSDIRDTSACWLAAGDISLYQAQLMLDYFALGVGLDLDCIKQTAGQFYYDPLFGSLVSFVAVLLLLN